MTAASPLVRLLLNPWLAWLLTLALLGMMAATMMQYRAIEGEPVVRLGTAGPVLADRERPVRSRVLRAFDDAYAVGQLHAGGDIASAYDPERLGQAQQRFAGASTSMPWIYPPPVTALMPLLPKVGLAWSYMLAMTGTLLLFLWVLVRVGSRQAGAAMLAVFPALMQVVLQGQDGFLTGALIGLVLLGLSHGRRTAGVPLGLTLVVRPHLTIALVVVAVLQRRLAVLAVALAVATAACLGATAMLGAEVWPAFLTGVARAGEALSDATFPLHRMASVYAGVRSLGYPAHTAMAVHVCFAMAALGLVGWAWKRRMRANRLLALTCVATLFVSPYSYDCDLACLAMAVSLVLPELLARARPGEMALFYALAWLASGAGLAQPFHAAIFPATTPYPPAGPLGWSLSAAGLLAGTALVAIVLRRRQALAVVGGRSAAALSGSGAGELA